jgi:4-diphosphocytidyl-2-C-methyl-D-erythritol kinase
LFTPGIPPGNLKFPKAACQNMKKSLRVRTPAKVNLYLGIVGRRPDGYHEIETVFQAIDLTDELIIKESDGDARLQVPGYPELDGEGNLVMKALRRLEALSGERLQATITLNKSIPAAAGLGGGSSDAAAALIGLRELFGLRLGNEDLARKALSLGADVPFFLQGGCAIGEGVGERLTPTCLLADYEILLINPGFAVPTASIYGHFDGCLTENAPQGRLNQVLRETRDPRGFLHNDLQSVSEKLYPEILEVRQTIIACGLSDSLMSGSGPTVFAISDCVGPARDELQERVRSTWAVFSARPVSHGVLID